MNLINNRKTNNHLSSVMDDYTFIFDLYSKQSLVMNWKIITIGVQGFYFSLLNQSL